MLKVGIIGTGVIFDLNILGYLNNNDVKITCLCNRTTEKAKRKIKQFNLESKNIRIYSDYKEMLDKEELDIVEILLPHHLHAEVTIYAARKGIKAISVQKPMALTLTEADKMIKACKDSGSILSIYENFLFTPHILKAKELIDLDYIGDPSSIRIKIAMGGKGGWNTPDSAKKWREDPKMIGGAKTGSPVLLDNGWHAFALARWFFDEDIDIVPQYGHMEFSLMPEMKLPSKYYSTDEFIEIIASRGIMKINQGTSLGNQMSKSNIFAPIVIVRDGKVETYSDFENDWKYSFINATKYFIEVVKGNKKPILSGEQARNVLKFNLAAVKSSELGKEVSLKEFS